MTDGSFGKEAARQGFIYYGNCRSGAGIAGRKVAALQKRDLHGVEIFGVDNLGVRDLRDGAIGIPALSFDTEGITPASVDSSRDGETAYCSGGSDSGHGGDAVAQFGEEGGETGLHHGTSRRILDAHRQNVFGLEARVDVPQSRVALEEQACSYQ